MSYRIYLLDEAGRISRARDVDCEDDAAAIATARLIASTQGVEIWQRTRLVASLPRLSLAS